MKMTKAEVLHILQNISTLSPSELKDSAHRLYYHKLAIGFQNAVDMNAFGALPNLIYTDATMVLASIEKDEDEGICDKNTRVSGRPLTPKLGCLGVLLGLGPVSPLKKETRPLIDFAAFMNKTVFELSTHFISGKEFGRLATLLDVSIDELAAEWHELFFAMACVASETAPPEMKNHLYSSVVLFWRVVYPAEFREGYDPTNFLQPNSDEYADCWDQTKPVKNPAFGAAMTFTRHLHLTPDIACSPPILMLLSTVIQKYYENLQHFFTKADALLVETYGDSDPVN